MVLTGNLDELALEGGMDKPGIKKSPKNDLVLVTSAREHNLVDFPYPGKKKLIIIAPASFYCSNAELTITIHDITCTITLYSCTHHVKQK